MRGFNRKKFIELEKVHAPDCVSMYMPTHKAGQAVLEKEDRIRLKNQIRQVKKELKEHQLRENEINALVKPAVEMLGDADLWHNMSEGLAIFLSREGHHIIKCPEPFHEFHFTGDHYHLSPLIPLLNFHFEYYILRLDLEDIRLFRCTNDGSQPLTDTGLPGTMEDVVGHDYEDKSLQFRTGQTGSGSGIFHGHGEGKDDKKKEIRKFFEHLDRELNDFLKGQDTPLLVATAEPLFSLYRSVNSYAGLVDEHILSKESMDEPDLTRQAREITRKRNMKKRHQDAARFHELLNNKKSSFELDDIIPASLNGRTETLFILRNTNIWGRYYEDTGVVREHEERKAGDTCLPDLAARKTIVNNGKVYTVTPGEMPDKTGAVNAIYRY